MDREFGELCSSCDRSQVSLPNSSDVICMQHCIKSCIANIAMTQAQLECQDGRLTFVDVQTAQQQASKRLEDRSLLNFMRFYCLDLRHPSAEDDKHARTSVELWNSEMPTGGYTWPGILFDAL